MNLDDVITLEDEKRYYIIDIVEHENVKYYLAVSLFPNDEVNIKEFNFLTFEKDNDEEYISIVDDAETLTTLYALEAGSQILESDPDGERVLEEIAKKLEDMDIK